uniref:Uncharacterized protein n=1 Tax=Oryza glumipatula TaxID=40148 RepID=A0A0E0AS94_9ORYZ
MVARRRVPTSVQSARFTRRCVLSAHRDFLVTRGGGGWNMSTPASGLLRYHPFLSIESSCPEPLMELGMESNGQRSRPGMHGLDRKGVRSRCGQCDYSSSTPGLRQIYLLHDTQNWAIYYSLFLRINLVRLYKE